MALLLWATLAPGLTGCATSSQNVVRVPGGQARVYVSVFVDETPRGEVGVALSEAVQTEIWQRDRSVLAMTFDRDALAIDGTVVSLEELVVEGRTRELRLRMKATLVDKAGRAVASLQLAESRGRYELANELELTEQHRAAALDKCIRDMARHIVTAIDQAGRNSNAA